MLYLILLKESRNYIEKISGERISSILSLIRLNEFDHKEKTAPEILFPLEKLCDFKLRTLSIEGKKEACEDFCFLCYNPVLNIHYCFLK